MTKRILFILAIVCLFSLSVASAKSYSMKVANSVQVGTVTLKPGEYSVKIDGSSLTMQKVDTGDVFTTTARTEKTDKKTSDNSLETTTVEGVKKVKAINFKGADFRVVFD